MSTNEPDWAARPINMVRTGPRGGTPVVLIHPVGLELSYWAGQIEALCDTYDVVAFDLPGHGRTPGGPADCTLDAMVRCLERVIRTTGAGPVHLVGLSVGGMIAQALTLAQPDLVRSLTPAWCMDRLVGAEKLGGVEGRLHS